MAKMKIQNFRDILKRNKEYFHFVDFKRVEFGFVSEVPDYKASILMYVCEDLCGHRSRK